MTDESIKETEQEDFSSEETEVNEPKYTNEQVKAMKHGWKPPEEFEGDEDDFISAAEFNRRAELFDKISKQKKELNKLKTNFTTLVKHHKKVEEATRDQVLKELKEQKVEALANEDYQKVVDIDEQLAEEAAKSSVDVIDTEQQAENQEAFKEWIVKNEWYNTNPQLAVDADAFGMAYGTKNPGATMEEILEYVDSKMAPYLSTTKAKPQSKPTVESASKSSGKGRKKSKYTRSDLDQNQQAMLDGILSVDPEMTEEKYIEELVKIGELK